MKIEVWSDVVCPWCFIGKRHLEAALDQFEGRDQVEVVWRSFELDPKAPAVRPLDYMSHLANKYGVSEPEARAMLERVKARAAGAGLSFRFDIARPGNTFDAHRLLHLAADRGVQDAVYERLFAATFLEGEPVGEREVLVRLAGEADLDVADTREILAGDAYGGQVRGDEERARRIRITGVPFFLIDGAYGVGGAQPPDMLLGVLREAAKTPSSAAPHESPSPPRYKEHQEDD